MVMKLRTFVGKHELSLWFRRGDFKRVLEPGWHWTLGLRCNDFHPVDTRVTKFEHPRLDVLVNETAVRERLTVLDLADDQRAFVWKNGRLGWVLGPGLHAFWNKPHKLDVELFDVSAFKLEHPKIEAILQHPGASRLLDGVRVEAHERLLVFRKGVLVDQAGAGVHVFWKNAGAVTWKAIDLREQVADVAGQEIMTADKVTLRVNMVATYQVTDPAKAVSVTSDYTQALYREAQLALREAVGSRPLDKLLVEKQTLGDELRNALASRTASFGITVRTVGLRDIILPGDMKLILNQVIEAQKRAEANLIKRREETAAARSQANTAKLLAESPALARMKELESLQEILAGAKTTFIFGSGDIAGQVRQLIGKEEP